MKILKIVSSGIRPSRFTVGWGLIQVKIRNPKIRRLLAKILTFHKRRVIDFKKVPKLNMLHEFGYTKFPQFISNSEANSIKNELEKMPCHDPWRREAGEFNFDTPPIGTHVGQISNAPAIDVLHELATRDEIVNLVTAYFGCKPVLDSIQAWWSYPGNDCAEEAEKFHRDNESIRFLKFFLYLTDVDENCGPHVLVEGSANSKLMSELRRYTDDEVNNVFGKNRIKYIVGKAGDAFIEDTYGVHKAQLPLGKRRLLVQFRYSVMPTIFRSTVLVNRGNCTTKSILSLVSVK